MRWNNLRIDAEAPPGETARLPGYRDAAVVRRFDAPEALDTRFYEVEARSILNRVPERSAMPFRWTINPYRGCSHACTYCAHPDTPVLMADGRHRRIADVQAGDRIYGTERRGTARRLVHTEVLAKWNTTKFAWRVTLQDETELIASGDHRFLTDRGWKHVRDDADGGQRPHLTRSTSLIGTGRFADLPAHDSDYQRGWLCGMVRGDGTIVHSEDPREGQAMKVDRSRLALLDAEALTRAHDLLRWDVGEMPFKAFAAAGQPAQVIGTGARVRVARIEELIRWPLSPADSWRKGFLAGIFDAAGSPAHILRISTADEILLGWTMDCFRHFGFDAVQERPGAAGLRDVRLRGGLVEHLRLLHLVDPAIRRKCSLEGQAVEGDARLGVVSVEPLGIMPLCDITTGTGDFIANGVVSHNCFARPTHTYLDMDAGRDFEREIVVKVNAPEVLRVELRRPSWRGEHVALGTNTDPYQWVESKYRLMPGIWEALRDARNPCSVLTKSPLLLRDLELFKEIAAVASITANLSVPTIDRAMWRATEPHTPHPRARLEAVAELNANGIPAGVLIAPLMPGINDDPRQVEEILRLASEAGATGVGGVALHLRGEVRGVFMDWLRSARPDLVERYEELYARGAYAPPEERRRLARLLRRGDLDVKPFLRDAEFPDALGGEDARQGPGGGWQGSDVGPTRDRPLSGRRSGGPTAPTRLAAPAEQPSLF